MCQTYFIEPRKGLRQDVCTRWNATFFMIKSALFYRVFCHLQLSDSNYKYCPSEDKLGRIEKINKFLEIFYNVTCIFFENKYLTTTSLSRTLSHDPWCDALSIHISSVASKPALSIGDHVLDQYQSSLKFENVEALICTRDRLFGEKCNSTYLEAPLNRMFTHN